RTIATIRDLQRQAAETEAARAAVALREKENAKDQAEHDRQSSEENWLNTVQAPAMRLDTMPLWSTHVIREHESVRRASAQAHTASTEMKRRATDWHAAVARRDAADSLARDAAKNEQRRRDEAALQESADQHARRRRTP